jgi:hypothetical protein
LTVSVWSGHSCPLAFEFDLARVDRTLLSDAFDFDLAFDPAACPISRALLREGGLSFTTRAPHFTFSAARIRSRP